MAKSQTLLIGNFVSLTSNHEPQLLYMITFYEKRRDHCLGLVQPQFRSVERLSFSSPIRHPFPCMISPSLVAKWSPVYVGVRKN